MGTGARDEQTTRMDAGWSTVRTGGAGEVRAPGGVEAVFFDFGGVFINADQSLGATSEIEDAYQRRWEADVRRSEIAEEDFAAAKKRAEEMEYKKAHAFEDPELFPLGERCVHFGLPRIGAGYNSYLQIVQTRDYLMIMNEMAHDARIIPIDNRPRIGDKAKQWNGESRAHWEGDTLVVETKHFSPKADLLYMGTAENLTLTERFSRHSADVLNYEFTMNDPTTWTRPWTAMIPLKAKDEQIFEYACHEANTSLRDMLRGHRYEEQQSKAGARTSSSR